MAAFNDPAFLEKCGLAIDALYQSALSQFESGAEVALIPDNVPSMIAEAIALRLSAATGKHLQVKRDATIAYLRIQKVASVASVAAMPEKKEKIPRPPNAFILYRQHHHNRVKAKNRGITNNGISKEIAAMWNAESEDVKAEWKAKAQRVKLEHALKHPGYTYQPRKAAERKRRSTKKKVEAVQALHEEIVMPGGVESPANLKAVHNARLAEATVGLMGRLPGLMDTFHPGEPVDDRDIAALPIPDFPETFPMDHDNQMRRQFVLPTLVTALDEFASNIDQHNESFETVTTPVMNLDLAADPAFGTPEVHHGPQGGPVQSTFSIHTLMDEEIDLINFDNLIDWNDSGNGPQAAVDYTNVADAELRDGAVQDWELDFS